MSHTEGRIPLDSSADLSLYYRQYGSGGRSILPLHGGPGCSSQYLEPLGRLADEFGTVTLFEQLGAGRSDTTDDPNAWTVDRRVEEVELVRRHLDLGRVDLFGQSWGGWLALSYVLRYPENVRSLILSNTSASVAEYLMRVQALRTGLGAEAHRTLLRAEMSGTFEDAHYQRAITELSARHLRRSWPFELQQSMREIDELTASGVLDMGPAYGHMWGPNEFVCTGPLLDWDVSSRLSEITAPTLVLAGYFDEFTMESGRTLADTIPDNEFVIFGNSSHMNTLERESEMYVDVLASFLRRHAT